MVFRVEARVPVVLTAMCEKNWSAMSLHGDLGMFSTSHSLHKNFLRTKDSNSNEDSEGRGQRLGCSLLGCLDAEMLGRWPARNQPSKELAF